MVCSCSVHLCTNRSKPGPRKIHFFSFPLKNAERTQQWVNAVGRKGFIPTKHSKVCSDNFHKNDFEQKSGGSYLIKLKGTAFPSIFPNYSDIISKAKKQCLQVEPFQVAVCSSYIPCTETNKPGELYGGFNVPSPSIVDVMETSILDIQVPVIPKRMTNTTNKSI
ncbi:THAP domain-containing protein 1-like isoform X2 [Acyrthosiphon pisum]|uniref:THAP-type domain-containing protein n=1 Tax=Acyrthosiphon pisum TaxID=7029 RepID=A0A8R2H5M4_ACYPI|nr:THAP domain-containing protein 1-like isoform X2 [Acyrthosiphon pisum]|eukprot:XP_016656969.1 PREDICTED: THAP domain-containing protein 1-like isoform X2 [Acyrthosiphon pisum]